jgi:hypothetical protein
MPAPDACDRPTKAVEIGITLGFLLAVVAIIAYFLAPGLVVSKRITVECKAAPPASAVPPTPSPEISKLTLDDRLVAGLFFSCIMVGLVKLMTTSELVDRMEKLEARLDQWGKHDATTRETIMKLLEPTPARQ